MNNYQARKHADRQAGYREALADILACLNEGGEERARQWIADNGGSDLAPSWGPEPAEQPTLCNCGKAIELFDGDWRHVETRRFGCYNAALYSGFEARPAGQVTA